MFGGSKPSFGTTPAVSGFGFNNTASASPFGTQPTFGKYKFVYNKNLTSQST